MRLVSILTIKGDHPEGNDFCGIYRTGCRHCVMLDDITIIRSKETAKNHYYKMWDLYHTKRQRQQCDNLAQTLQQHFVEVIIYLLYFFQL